ncbi:glycosyltransferase [Aquirufa sp. 5-AUSEE-100C1]
MFKKIFEEFKQTKLIVNQFSLDIFYRFLNGTVIVSAGSPRQNLFFIFGVSLIAKNVLVYTPFGFDLYYFKVKFPRVKNFVYKFLLSRNNISFITCSLEQKSYLKIRFPKQEVFVIRNIVLNSSLCASNVYSKKMRVFYVGRVDDQQKNVSFFIELKKLIQHEIFLIGECRSKDLELRIKRSGVIIRSSSLSPYNDISLNDLIVLPSHYEGAALVVIEAATLGIPVFLMNTVGNKQITANPILFNNHLELVNLINLLHNKDSFLLKRIELFRKEILNEYSQNNFLLDIKFLSDKLKTML